MCRCLCARARAYCRRACQRLKCSVRARALATACFFCSLHSLCFSVGPGPCFFFGFFGFTYIWTEKYFWCCVSRLHQWCFSGLSFHFHPSLYMFLILVFSIRFSVVFSVLLSFSFSARCDQNETRDVSIGTFRSWWICFSFFFSCAHKIGKLIW